MENGSVACWGNDSYGQATPPAGPFLSVSAGFQHACGVKEDGAAACWGNDSYGQATPPAGPFLSVSAGTYHTCGGEAEDHRVAVLGAVTAACGGVVWRM